MLFIAIVKQTCSLFNYFQNNCDNRPLKETFYFIPKNEYNLLIPFEQISGVHLNVSSK
jgi:hypothetical protein